MDDVLYEKITQAAKENKTVTYKDLASSSGTDFSKTSDRSKFFAKLQEICKHEVDNGRPMLCSIVVKKSSSEPGEGFFKLAKEIGRFDGNDKEKFYKKELSAVFSTWKV